MAFQSVVSIGHVLVMLGFSRIEIPTMSAHKLFHDLINGIVSYYTINLISRHKLKLRQMHRQQLHRPMKQDEVSKCK